MSFETDRAWADARRDNVREILQRHLAEIVQIRFASDEEDTKQATDMVVEIPGGTVAIRVRDTLRTFRDWTVRTTRSSGVKTELQKIKDGFARWYFYAWCAPDACIGDYVLIDLDRVRGCGILNVPRRQFSADNGVTTFIGVPVDELRKACCLVVDACRTPSERPRSGCLPAPSVKVDPGNLPW